jgi:hypothetical protein
LAVAVAAGFVPVVDAFVIGLVAGIVSSLLGKHREIATRLGEKFGAKPDGRGLYYWNRHRLLLPLIPWLIGMLLYTGFLAELALLPSSWHFVKSFGSCGVIAWIVDLHFKSFYIYVYSFPAAMLAGKR